MKKVELRFSTLCFLLALAAAGLMTNGMVSWGFIVAWGGSALVVLAYAVVVRRRSRDRQATDA